MIASSPIVFEIFKFVNALDVLISAIFAVVFLISPCVSFGFLNFKAENSY